MGRFLFLSLGLLVVAFSLIGTGADHPCPSDWSSFDHFCYKVVKQWKNWTDAEASCAQLQNGSHLASIQSEAESFYVARLVSSNVRFTSVWIGLIDPEKNRTWKWSDGSEFGYTAWERREPNNVRPAFCIRLSRWSKLFSSKGYHKWKTVKCDSKRFFICKFQPQSGGSN